MISPYRGPQITDGRLILRSTQVILDRNSDSNKIKKIRKNIWARKKNQKKNSSTSKNSEKITENV